MELSADFASELRSNYRKYLCKSIYKLVFLKNYTPHTHIQILSITELEANSISMIHVFTITDHVIKCGLIKIFYESLTKVKRVMIFLLGIAVARVSTSNLLFPSPDSVMLISFSIRKSFMKTSSSKVLPFLEV